MGMGMGMRLRRDAVSAVHCECRERFSWRNGVGIMGFARKKWSIAGCVVLVIAVLVVCLPGWLSGDGIAASDNVQMQQTVSRHVETKEPTAEPGDSVSLGSGGAGPPSEQRTASDIYANSNLDMVERFHSLLNLQYLGNADAEYLAYRMRETCRMAAAMSKDTVLPELWNEAMGRALQTLRTRCGPLVEDAMYRDFAEKINGLPVSEFNDDIPVRIKQAFADSGSSAAMEVALAEFQDRPDRTTARLVSETLAKLGVLQYDPRLQVDGIYLADARAQKRILFAALMLHSCDFGVPCGPGSDRMLRICAFTPLCQPGQGLYQYFSSYKSPKEMKNVQSLLDAMRRMDAAS